jgi:predicted esterase
MPNLESLELAGVPVVVRPHTHPSPRAPLIVLWHGFGVPNSSEMLAKVLPLSEV